MDFKTEIIKRNTLEIHSNYINIFEYINKYTKLHVRFGSIIQHLVTFNVEEKIDTL